jgi:hypothetical protein
MHGMPWTMHLEGMYNILRIQGLRSPGCRDLKFRNHLIEVMGVMDLPPFVIGRQTPCFEIWRHYCMNNIDHSLSDRCEVEPVSGLPRSLLDLYSGIGTDSSEKDLWNWPGAKGSLLQCQLWEAHRLAAILTVRRNNRKQKISGTNPGYQKTLVLQVSGSYPAPDSEIMVLRILSCMDAIRRACTAPEEKDSPVTNATNYPLFTAGLEVEVLRRNPDLKDVIRYCFKAQCQDYPGLDIRVLMDLLEDVWKVDDPMLDVDDIARSLGIETGLL